MAEMQNNQKELPPEAPRSNGRGSRMIAPAAAKQGRFAVTVNRLDTFGVLVAVDRERGVPVWRVAGAEKHYGR